MSGSEFFDGSDSGEGLPAKFTLSAEEVERGIETIHEMVTVEIDRTHTRSNHLNKMMRMLIQQQEDVQKQTNE